MNVLGFFESFFTGYKFKTKEIQGVVISYKYAGKPVLFDPISMLLDLKYKIQTEDSSPGVLRTILSEIPNNNLLINETLNPTVEAKFQKGGESFEIIRCVKTLDSIPCSRYQFFLNKSHFCTFHRRYDYGKEFAPMLKNISPFINSNDSPINFWKNNNNEALFLEHFGHTQLWVIKKYPDLELAWSKLEN